jgi:hypothetical protein
MGWLVSAVFLGLSTAAAAQPVPVNRTPDATLRSTPETVIWGYFAADIPPVLRIKSGQTVKIDTVSHGGVNTGVDPVTFFGRAGIAPDQVLKDAVDIYQKVARPKGASAHILTGPIYIEEAAPGDMLEIRTLALEPRVPYVQQLKSRDRCLAGPPHRTDAESHQVRCGAERGVVLQRHRGAAAAVHGHHGGSPDTGIMDDQLAPALALGWQHGFQQADRRGDALPAGIS